MINVRLENAGHSDVEVFLGIFFYVILVNGVIKNNM